MAVVWVELAGGELLVVFFDVTYTGVFHEFVTVVHLYAEGVERTHNLAHIGDDGVFRIRQLGQVVTLDFAVEAEFHLLRVDKDELQLCRVLAVKQ